MDVPSSRTCKEDVERLLDDSMWSKRKIEALGTCIHKKNEDCTSFEEHWAFSCPASRLTACTLHREMMEASSAPYHWAGSLNGASPSYGSYNGCSRLRDMGARVQYCVVQAGGKEKVPTGLCLPESCITGGNRDL